MPMNRGQARVVDPVLSRVALGYANPIYVGRSLFPQVESPAMGARIIKFGKEAFIKHNMRRAPGGRVARIQYGYSSDPIALVQDSLEGLVPREWLRDSQQLPSVQHGERAINNVMNSMHLSLEIEQAELAMNASNYGVSNKVTLSGTDKWTDPSSDPGKQIRDYKEVIRKAIGVYPNVLEIPPAAWNALAEHPKLQDRFKYTSKDSLTVEMAAAYFELNEVVIGQSVYAPDEMSPMQDVWTDAVLAYVPRQGQSVDVPSFGYTYVMPEHPMVEEAYFDKAIKSYVYPTEFERRAYLTGMDAGFLIQNIV